MLHGTGGNEEDLLPIAEMIAPDASVLGVRGNVLENGMPRFFRRLAEGVFDIEDLVLRTEELNNVISEFANKYSFDRNKVIALGYSNGANMAASLLYHHEYSLHGAILFHAMVPREDVERSNLSGVDVFISAGKRDSLIAPKQTKALIEQLEQSGADVTSFWIDGGHQLSREEVEAAKAWFEKNY